MKREATILLSIFLIIEIAYMLFGVETSKLWDCLYFFNQSLIICGGLLIMRDYINFAIVSCVIGISLIKLAYNVLLITSPDLAEKINNSSYVVFSICLSLVLYLIFKIFNNDSKRAKK